MKILRYLMIAALLLSLIGCAQEKSVPVSTQEGKPNPPESAHEEKASQPEQYETNLVFIKKTAEIWTLVDERGNIHQVNVSQVDPSIPAGSTTKGKVSINQIGEKSLDIDTGYSMSYVRMVEASYEEAPRTYADLLLDSFLYSSNPDYAVSAYELKDVQIKNAYGSGRIDAVMTFDVKPSEGAYYWGPVEGDRWLRNRQINFTIYGTEGTWLSTDSNAKYFSPNNEPLKAPQFKYTPTENQNVIYEDELWSYYGDKDFLPPRNNEKDYANLKEYMGTINRVNRQTGETEILYQGDRNYSYKLFCRVDIKLYLLSDTWEPMSEGHPGYFGVLDLETKEYKKLIEGGVVRGAIDGETGYLFANDKLVVIDLKTAETKVIYSLNFNSNYAYDYVRVNRIKDGKMYFGIFGVSLKQYVIDLNSGDITEII